MSATSRKNIFITYSIKGGKLSIKANLSNDGKELTGITTLEPDGVPYTIPFNIVKITD